MTTTPNQPTPYYQDEAVTIYHGDCREVLPALAGRVDLVLTDPPYGISYRTQWRAAHDPLRVGIANDDSLSVVADAWPVIMNTLRDNRHWYAFASPRKIAEAAAIYRGHKQVMVWDKGDKGTVGDLKAGFAESWEAVFYGMIGRRELNGKRARTLIRYNWCGARDPVHPTVKPVGLLQYMVGWSSEEGEVVLDPFMGSGTTLFAAKNLNRRAIGVEIEEKYCEIAAKRCSQGVLAL